MAKQKKLNKNLVAFLTVMGIVLTVSVVALATWQGTRRDPEAVAKNAREREQAGDLPKAIQLYNRAYTASEERELKYLIDAARCWFQLGKFPDWLGTLKRANSKDPKEQAVLVAVLEGLWRTQQVRGSGIWWQEWRDNAEKLLELDEQNMLALVCAAYGAWGLGGDENVKAANAFAQKAHDLKPDDPRAALAYVELRRREIGAEVRDARAAGASAKDIAALTRKFVDEIHDNLTKAIAANPGDAILAATCAELLQEEARQPQAGQEGAPPTAELIAQAHDLLETALSKTPQSPELHLAMARNLRAQLVAGQAELSNEEFDKQRAAIDAHAVEAVKLDPAMYDAYMMRADLKLLGRGGGGEFVAPTPEQTAAALDIFDEAAKATLTLRNVRALLTEDQRLLLLRRALIVALRYLVQSPSADEAQRRLERAERFLKDAQTKWGDHAITYYMQGDFALAKNDVIGALQAFERAREKGFDLQFWLRLVQVDAPPIERLALLYWQQRQLGEAERCAVEALGQYEQAALVPPIGLIVARADLFAELLPAPDGLQRALELLSRYSDRYANDPTWKKARISVLTKLDRKQEAEQLGQAVTGTDVATRVWQARIAIERKDYTAAEETLRGVLSDHDATDGQFGDALDLLVSMLTTTNRRTDAQELVKTLRQAPGREGVSRWLQAYEAVLSEEDPQKQDEKLLPILEQNPNAVSRGQALYNYWRRRGDAGKALGYLLELRKLRPDDLQLTEAEFELRVQLKQLDQAAELLVPLSHYDENRGVDRAGGATYRGELALARGDAELAIREFRQAVLSLPTLAQPQVNLARAYLTAGRSSEGIEVARRATEISPRNFEAWLLLVLGYEQRAGQGLGTEKDQDEKAADQALAKAAELNPNHPAVKQRQERQAENRDPLAAIANREKRRAEQPDDAENLIRLGQLYQRPEAWDKLAGKEEAKGLAERGDKFFQAVVPKATGDAQLSLAQSATTFYARSQQRAPGEALLRSFRELQKGPNQVFAQLLLARLLESQADVAAAEREYQESQRLAGQVTTDPAERQRLDTVVGFAFIQFYQRQRLPAKVIESCRWLLDRLGKQPQKPADAQQARQSLIDAYFDAGQHNDAEPEIDAYKQAYGEDLFVLERRAQLPLVRNQREEAQQALTKVLQKDPEHVWALLTRGRIALQRAKYTEAREDLTKARGLIDRRPDLEGSIHQQLTDLYERTQQLDLAAAELRALLATLDKARARPEAKQQVVARLVDVLRRANHFDQAQQLVSEYMEKYPEEPIWPLQLGQLVAARGDELNRLGGRDADARQAWATAATYYQRAQERCGDKNPVLADQALQARLGLLVKTGRAREAIEVFKKIEHPSPGLRVSAAKAYGQNDPAAARTQWQQALQEASAQDIKLTGGVAGELRQALPADTEALLTEAVQAAPAETESGQRLRIVLAEHLGFVRKHEAGLARLNEVLAATKGDSRERLAALLARGQLQGALDDMAGAVATYKEVLTLHPDEVVALNNLAYVLVEDEKSPVYGPKEALQYAERLSKLMTAGTTTGSALDTIGWVYFRNNQVDLAIATLEEALSRESERNLPAYEHLAEAYAKVSRTADARKVLNRGLETVKSRIDPEAQEYRRRYEKRLGELQ